MCIIVSILIIFGIYKFITYSTNKSIQRCDCLPEINRFIANRLQSYHLIVGPNSQNLSDTYQSQLEDYFGCKYNPGEYIK